MTQVLIIGTGRMARTVWREIRTKQHRRVSVVGFVGVNGAQDTYPEIASKYLGDLNDIERILRQNTVDTVLVAASTHDSMAVQLEQALVRLAQFDIDIVFESAPDQSKGSLLRVIVQRRRRPSRTGRFLQRFINIFA